MTEIETPPTDGPKDDKPPTRTWDDLSKNTQSKYRSLGLTPEQYNAGERPARTDRKPKSRTKAKGKSKSLKVQVRELIESIGGFVMLVNPYDGQVISEVAPRLTDDLMGMADRNPRVRAALESAVSLSENAGIGVTLMTLAIPIAANHGLIPKPIGQMAAPMLKVTPPPDVPTPGMGAMLGGLLKRQPKDPEPGGGEHDEHVHVRFEGEERPMFEESIVDQAADVVTNEGETEGRPAYRHEPGTDVLQAIRGEFVTDEP